MSRMYNSLKLRKPSRESVAEAMFGRRSVSIAVPQRQANADAIFNAALEAQNHVDFPSFMPGLSGLGNISGGLGALPAKEIFIPINHPGPPWDVGDAVFGISRGWGKVDGLAPGNLRVPNFEARYKKAQAVAAKADDFQAGSPISNMAAQFNARMSDAMRRVLRHYIWDQACGFGNDPESPIWDNCRSKGQVDALKTALADVNNALNNYDQLELAMVKAPPEWRTDYIAPIDFDSYDPGAGKGTGAGANTGQTAYDLAFGANRGGGQTQQSRGASTVSGPPGWALPVAGVALLGILAGGLYFLEKK